MIVKVKISNQQIGEWFPDDELVIWETPHDEDNDEK